MRLIDTDAFAERMLKIWNKAEEENRMDIVNVLANIVTPILVGTPTIEAEPVWIVHSKDGVYDVYKGNRNNWVIARLSADNVFSWLAEQNLVDIRFVDESLSNCGAKMDGGADNG